MVAEPEAQSEPALFEVDPALVEIRPTPVKLPARLSPSRAGDFVQCPLMFRFRSVDRLPEPPSPAATLGTLVHAVLERLFDKPAGERTPRAAHDLVAPEWEKLLAGRPELAGLFDSPQAAADWLASAGPLLDRYFTLEDPNRYEPARREWRVDTVIGEGEDRLRVGGIIDRVDIAPNGMVRVVDYKTGKAPPPGYESKVMFQMKFYALVLWRLQGRVPKRLQLIFMGSGSVLAYDPDERDLLATEQKVAAIWQAVREAARSKQWQAKPSRLCGWCAFKPLCPAHGGEPPPAPDVIITPVST